MLANTTLVSTSFIVGKAIAPAIDPTILLLFRFGIAALLFLPFIQHKFGLQRPSNTALTRYALISGCLVGFFWLMFLALRYTSALNIGVLFTLVPGISHIYAILFLKEHIQRYQLVALIPATTGAVMVLFHGDLSQLLNLDLNRGDLLFFFGCLLMGLYNPMVKKFHRGEPMAIMTFWVLVTGICWLIPLSAASMFTLAWKDVAISVWGGIVYLAIFTTLVTFFLSQWATVHIGPTRVMSYSFLYPPFVVLFDLILGKGLPPVQTLLGVILIVPAMVAIQFGIRQGKKPGYP